ncbi:ELF3-like protein 2 isoform X2 [Selaginella moellendorffii]|uniref:ELF3-like protein 2 isoform X2 n=1 Tax=Selaginella moellendorffii TaxID=88036 RepID=UPI000D1C4A8A|nr:ELF3-like protein 2 isoform X2 [Selaginella moellendorffii]|eukprot:XP_024538140.1 ELF3-like protein 2 isoform X2 [Selaginella moellendorffii]
MEDKNAPPGGALFPRLHVKETKNAGPRAPPRNKMALYEQFTVPSHRCQQQQSDGAPPQPFVPQALNGGYYFPYYMVPSPVAFQPMNVVLGQHSQSVANETEQRELQQVPGDGSSNRQLARIPSLHSRARSGKTKTGAPRVDDVAAVPTYPSKPAAVPARSSKQELFASASVAPSNASTSATKSQRQVEVRETTQARKDSRPRNRAPGDLGDQENGSEVRVMASSSPSHSYESNEDNGRIDNQSDEELEGRGSPEEVEASDDSATSVVENNAAPSAITSKEIMSAVGDEEFWKMRKAMQRQQTIFQKQLFELHRLTKVQHLMANSKISDPSKTQDEKTDKRVGSEPTHCGEAPKTSKPDPKPDQAPAPKTPSQTQPLSTTPYDYTTHPRPIQAANTINYATYHPAYNQCHSASFQHSILPSSAVWRRRCSSISSSSSRSKAVYVSSSPAPAMAAAASSRKFILGSGCSPVDGIRKSSRRSNLSSASGGVELASFVDPRRSPVSQGSRHPSPLARLLVGF